MSIGDGTSASLGYAFKPAISSTDGLTGTISKPTLRKRNGIACAAFSGSRLIPTTAMRETLFSNSTAGSMLGKYHQRPVATIGRTEHVTDDQWLSNRLGAGIGNFSGNMC